MEWVLEHPIFQSSIRWEDGGSRAACLHLASLFGLRSARAQGLVRPLACLPGVWDQSASGSQRRPEHSRERQRAQWGRAGPSGANAARRGIRSLRISRIYAGECQYSIQADLRATVTAAHASGALALIAHPGRREAGFTLYTPDLLDAVSASVPVDGIEVRYPLHTPAQVAEYERYARQRGWLQSAGSDSHARQQRLPIPYPAAAARELLERCGVHVVD